MALAAGGGKGQVSVIHRPRWSVIGRILRRQSAVFVILLLPPFLAALLEGQGTLCLALGVPAAAAGIVAFTSRDAPVPDDVRRAEAGLSVVAVFALGCIATIPAYLVLGLGPVDALFEATSALTTTGFSMTGAEIGTWPAAGHVLRAWSQWCGGLVIAIAGLAFLMDRGPVSKALGLVDFGEAQLKSSARLHARALLVAYVGLTLLGAIGAALLVPGVLEGPLLALAAVSTGGMTPRADGLAGYDAGAQAFIVLLSALGAVSLALPVLMYRGGIAAALRATAALSLVKAFALAIIAYALLFTWLHGFDPARLARGLLNLVSLQSTTGFLVEPLTAETPLLLLLIVAMAVGGQTGSTAGGLKLDRVRILLHSFGFVLRRLQSPSHAVTYFRLDGEVVEPDRLLFAVAILGAYLSSALLFWIAFTLAGAPPLGALFDIVSALSTVGAGTGVIGPDLSPALKLLAVLAMFLGRLEFFALILLLSPRTWQRRE